MSFSKTFFLGDTEFEVEFSATPYVAARTSGPAEMCHPAEGGEVEIESITVGSFDMMEYLSDATIKALQDKCEDCAGECISDHNDSAMADEAESRAFDRENDWD